MGWLAWADAVVLELMSIAAGLELRRRKRAHVSVAFPGAVLAAAVVLSLGAQVVEAERSALAWIAAAIPALGFLVMVKIALAHAATDVVPPESRPDRATSTPATTHVTGTAGVPEGRQQSQAPPSAPVASAPKADPVVASLIPAARAAATRWT